MRLELRRTSKKPYYTIGRLSIDGKLFCETLEDTDRGLDSGMSLSQIKSTKVYGKTAIPTGTYEVAMDIVSPKYSTKQKYSFTNGYMPRLLRVPGYEGVLLHPGNTAEDTYGCILVGYNTSAGRITDSFGTFRQLYQILSEAHRKRDRIYITIA